MLTRTFFARAPLAPGRFAPLPVGAVSAQGAMRDRLLALRGGLLSRCASLFPEAGEQSAWFGGALGGGMHAPELLEAMLLTGAQLGDEELRREALHLCGLVVEHQREDGSFGAPGETFAARGRMLRALCAAYSMSGDKQLLTFMLRYMKYLHDPPRALPVRRGRDAHRRHDGSGHSALQHHRAEGDPLRADDARQPGRGLHLAVPRVPLSHADFPLVHRAGAA